MTAALRAPVAEAFGALAGVFRTPNLRRLELAYVASLAGMWGYATAAAVYVFGVGGVALVGVSAAIRLVPAAVAAPFAAVLADRYSRRRVMLVTDLARGVLIAVIAASVAAGLPPAIVLVVLGFVTVVSTAFEPAKNAILPSLVREPEQLTAANVATSTFESTSMFAGPALAALVLVLAGAAAALAVAACLMLCSVLLLSRIEEPQRAQRGMDERGEEEEEGLVSEALAGVRTIAGDWRLRVVVGLLGAQVLVDGALVVFVVVVAIDLLDLGQGGVGLLDSAAGVGGLLGAAAALAIAGRRGLGTMFGLGVAAWGVPLILIAALPQPAIGFVALALVGAINSVVDAAGYTLLQRSSPDEVRGRVFGAFEALAIAAVALGSLVTSALVTWLGVQGALLVVGAFLPAVALPLRRALRRLDEEAPPLGAEVALLRAVPMFAPLAAQPLEQLASRLERRTFATGSEVIRQGEPGERFYVIEGGEVEVIEDGQAVRREGPGDFFGEIALIRDVPRTATVVALSDLSLLTLEREAFIAAVTGHTASTQAADAVIGTRLGSVRAGAGSV